MTVETLPADRGAVGADEGCVGDPPAVWTEARAEDPLVPLLSDDPPPPRQAANIAVLACCFVVYMAAFTAQLTASALAAEDLGYKSLATLPLAATFAGQVLSVIPASALMRRHGRRAGFAVGGLCCIVSGAVGWVAMHQRLFPLLIVAGVFLGMFGGCSQYIRYAACEASSAAFQSKALSWVMSGGAIMSVVGPQVASTAHAIGGYAAFYAAVGGCGVLFLCILALLRLPPAPPEEGAGSGDGAGAPPAPSYARAACAPGALAAVGGCFGAYWGMVFVMTGTPVRMDAVGFSLSTVSRTIQVHLLGMFVPGLLTGYFIDATSPRVVLACGALMLCGCVPLLRGADTLPRLMPGLGLLGVGWNLAYVSSTKLLVAVPLAPADASRLQAIAELLTACGDTTASLLAAVVINRWGWDALLWVAFPPVVLAAAGAAAGGAVARYRAAAEGRASMSPSTTASRVSHGAASCASDARAASTVGTVGAPLEHVAARSMGMSGLQSPRSYFSQPPIA